MNRKHDGLGGGSVQLARIACFDFAIVFLFSLLMLGCGGGSSSTPPGTQVTPPANLTYPQPTINATVGVATSVDTPTVTGTVSSYEVTPRYQQDSA